MEIANTAKPFASVEEELEHHIRRGNILWERNMDLQEKLEKYEANQMTLEQLIENRAEFGFEATVELVKEEGGALFYERGNCAWAEMERAVGIVPLEDTEGHGDVTHKLALFDFDGNYVEDWHPTSDDVLACDWRIADMERNRAFREKFAEMMKRAKIKTDVKEVLTFEEFVEYGKAHGGNIVNGMPWSFEYKGHPITHENDECYLIPAHGSFDRFTPSDVLIVGENGEIYVRTREFFEQNYEIAEPTA